MIISVHTILKIGGLLLLTLQSLYAQQNSNKILKYREDQFYIGVAYSASLILPSDTFQNNLSYNIHLGFIRDFPINKACNRAIGIGIGYSTHSHYSNILATKNSEGVIRYNIIDPDFSYVRNKIETHEISLPIEFRWRTSTYKNYTFWRIYLGFKISYIFYAKSKLVGKQEQPSFEFYNDDVNPLQYSTYLTFNFKGSWNIFVDYSLNNLFRSGIKISSNNKPINTKILDLGVRFYLL